LDSYSLVKEKHMGIFDVLSGKEHPGDFLVNSAAKGVKAGANAAKAAAAKAKMAKEEKAVREAEEAETEESAAGPKFCPHCGKSLR
jgi:hypothetical protein